MALKKSEIYSSLWASCDELRGGMDASQYKDYVLSLLFIKYISDKYAGISARRSPIKIPEGASFSDMVALKGTKDIGDKINTRIIEPLATELARMIEMAGDARIVRLRSKQGKLTLKPIIDRIKQTDDAKEKLFLENYFLSDQTLKGAKQQVKDLNEAAKATVSKGLNARPNDESLGDLRVIEK